MRPPGSGLGQHRPSYYITEGTGCAFSALPCNSYLLAPRAHRTGEGLVGEEGRRLDFEACLI